MLVVMAIIALLLAALLPAFSSVRNQAKYAQANAQFRALDTGLNSFRAENALGGALPPSVSDAPLAQRGTIADPLGNNDTVKWKVSGAHLLVHALLGADGLGTAGFRDLSRNGDGWWNDTYGGTVQTTDTRWGLYSLGQDGQTKVPRYPAGGAGYVDEKMKERAESLQQLADEGKALNTADPAFANVALKERLFMDPWDHPILYYRANPSSLRVTGKLGSPGIYWQEDNAILTGSSDGDLGVTEPGVDFGQGTENNALHAIKKANGPEPNAVVAEVLSDSAYDGTFARFILDASVKARPTPVQKDSYLLISAGPDSRYGTNDDVLNWTRKTE